MEIEQVIKISQLYDFYSELLSDKQKQYLNDYYFNDLSLTEISENYNISKQAVSNNIKRTVLELEQFEEKLNLIKLNNQRLFLLNEIKKSTNDTEASTSATSEAEMPLKFNETTAVRSFVKSP